MEKKLNLSDITNLSVISESYSHSAQDYVFSHFVFNDNIKAGGETPVRFDGITVVVVLRGCVDITIGSQNITMEPATATIMGPDDVIAATHTRNGEVELYTLFLSTDFLSGINFDVNILNPRYLIDHEPVLCMTDEQVSLVCSYLSLLHQCAISNSDAPQQLSLITRSIGRNIVVALLYQFAFMNEKRHFMTQVNQGDRVPVRSRKLNYVHDFMHLLQQNYRSERTVSFYASKLCISPKYLSLLVREVTGHTAAAIIDRYVINEAKNMLRFSGYTIQQVAYKLNFPNQSAFGKYFKHITGQSPTAFRSN